MLWKFILKIKREIWCGSKVGEEEDGRWRRKNGWEERDKYKKVRGIWERGDKEVGNGGEVIKHVGEYVM